MMKIDNRKGTIILDCTCIFMRTGDFKAVGAAREF